MWYGSLVFRHGRSRPLRAIPLEQPAPEPLPVGGTGNRGTWNRPSLRPTGTRETPCDRWTLRTPIILKSVKIYTKTGDSGDTGLFGGTRVSKADPRVAAYGDVDELNAWLGVARATLRASGDPADLAAMLEQIQRDLFALGARLADPGAPDRRPRRPRRRSAPTTSRGSRTGSTRSRRRCRRCGGSSSPADRTAGAALHVARTVCRRAERAMVALCGRRDAFEPDLLIYINRLSDLLFVMARAREPARRDARNRVVSPELARRLRLLRAAGAVALRELSRSPRACCRRAMRPHVAAIYAFARMADDFADEGEPLRRRAPRALDDWGARLRRVRSRRVARRRPASRGLHRAAPHDRRVPSARRRSSTICSARSGRTSPSSDTRRGTICSTTAADRPTRSAGWSCASRATSRRALDAASDAVCTALQLTNFWQDLGSTGPMAASYVPAAIWRRRGARETGSGRRPHDAGVAPRAGRARPPRPRAAVRRRRGRSATASTDACARSCARPGWAACGFSISSRRRISTSSARGRR